MNKSRMVLIVALALAVFVGLLAALGVFKRGNQTRSTVQVEGLPIPIGSSGFTRAKGPRPLSFPADHGAHDDFQTEWWYLTGNLSSADGRAFGFQLTFFRRAITPPGERVERQSAWATDQVYLAHFALTDVSGGKFHAFERLSRGAAGLAGAQGQPDFRVWLDDWQMAETGPGSYEIRAAAEGVALELALQDRKGAILQGDRGYSQKGPERGNASIYYSLTRLESAGTLSLAGETFAVNGTSWMDHEFSTSALSGQQSGWDWFALQLDNGYELMVYTIRNADGSIDAYSRGILVAPDGETRALARADFDIQVEARWSSPLSGAAYPARWTINVPSADLRVSVEPLLADQEFNVSFIYWEGAVRVSGTLAGEQVSGRGYVELTGYARSMQGEF